MPIRKSISTTSKPTKRAPQPKPLPPAKPTLSDIWNMPLSAGHHALATHYGVKYERPYDEFERLMQELEGELRERIKLDDDCDLPAPISGVMASLSLLAGLLPDD